MPVKELKIRSQDESTDGSLDHPSMYDLVFRSNLYLYYFQDNTDWLVFSLPIPPTEIVERSVFNAQIKFFFISRAMGCTIQRGATNGYGRLRNRHYRRLSGI